MVEVTKADGKKVEIDCEYFADENTPLEYANIYCRGCPVRNECWLIFTRRY